MTHELFWVPYDEGAECSCTVQTTDEYYIEHTDVCGQSACTVYYGVEGPFYRCRKCTDTLMSQRNEFVIK